MNIFKTFETFEAGREELLSIVPVIKDYIGEAPTESEAITKLLSKLQEDIPTINNPGFPNTYAATFAPSEVGFKSKDYLSFGWKTRIEEGKISVSFRVTIAERNKFTKKTKIETDLVAAGWRAVQTAYRPRTDARKKTVNSVSEKANVSKEQLEKVVTEK